MNQPGWKKCIVASIAVLAMAAGAVADVPRLIHYQGKLRDAGGVAVTGSMDLRVRLYGHPTQSTPILFDETHSAVPLNQGLFSVLIGSETVGGVADSALDASEVYLGVSIDGGTELSPRNRVATGPHAVKARSAEQLVRPGTFVGAAIVDGGGNLGIGTATPQGRLDVNGTLAIAGSKGSTGQVLTSQGGSTAPVWADPAGGDAPTKLVREFTVAAGETLSAGDVVSFMGGQVGKGFGIPFGPEAAFVPNQNFDSSDTMEVAGLSATSFVIVYQDQAASNFGKAIIGTVSGNTISYGSPTTFSSASSVDITVAALSSTQFVVGFRAGSSTVRIGTVSGTSISYGTATNLSTGGSPISLAALSPSKFAVAYRAYASSGQGTAQVGDVSGSNITLGSTYVFNPGSETTWISARGLSGTKFVVCYQDQPNSGRGTAVIGDVSGNAISFGSEQPFDAASNVTDISVTSLDVDKFVVAYKDSDNNNRGSAVVGSVSGTSISYGVTAAFDASFDAAKDISATALNATTFAVAYRDQNQNSLGIAALGSVSGTTISYGANYVYNSSSTSRIFAGTLGATGFVIAYGSYSPSRTAAVVANMVDASRVIGVAGAGGSGGSSIPVIVAGVSDVHSGLTTDRVMYAKTDGTLTTTPTANRVGLAISSTEILLDGTAANPDQFFGDMVFANQFRITEALGPQDGLMFVNHRGDALGVLDQDGRLGVGTIDPRHALQVGDAYCDGGSWMDAASRESAVSVSPLETGDAMATLSALEPVRFTRAGSPGEEHVGFIGEEAPALVASSDGRGVGAMDVVGVLTRVVKEQQAALAEMRARLDSQEQVIREQRDRLSRLEAADATKPAPAGRIHR